MAPDRQWTSGGSMLGHSNSSAILAVTDLKRARDFYEKILGLEIKGEKSGGTIAYKTGSTVMMIYHSDFAGTNKANAVVWGVGDQVDAIAKDLKSKGVQFEHYPSMPNTKLEGDVHVSGKMRLVWFKDPDGNILHFNNI